jgi:hypothetical protein
MVPGYLSNSPTCARPLPPLIARPPSNHVRVWASAITRAHSLFSVCQTVVVIKKGGRRVTVAGLFGPLVRGNQSKSSVRCFPAAPTRRVVVVRLCLSPRRDYHPCRLGVLPPPGDVAWRRSSPPMSALPWCRFPTGKKIRRCSYDSALIMSPQRTVGPPVSFARMTVATPMSLRTFPICVGGTKGYPRGRAG